MASMAWVQTRHFGVCPESGTGVGSDGEDFNLKSALPTGVYAFPTSKLIHLKPILEGNTLTLSLGCISLSVKQALFILIHHTLCTAK